MPSTLKILVPSFEGRAAVEFDLQVEKLPEDYHKLYLGGFRHTLTGQVYHHACTQTVETMGNRFSMDMYDHLRTRETQTVSETTKSLQTNRETGTQMERSGLFLSSKGDRTLSAFQDRYVTASFVEERKKEKVLAIQTAWRGYLGKKRAWARRELLVRRKEEEQERLQQAVEEREEEARGAIDRRLAPSSMKEFAALYNELNAWKEEEVRKINEREHASEAERVHMLQALLERQTKVLQTIDRMKADSVRESNQRKREELLRALAKPKVWENSDGKTTSVHTPTTTRASELLQLYEALSSPVSSVDERLDILFHVKETVREFRSHLTTNIADLAGREADLLTRGRSLKSMAALRKRIKNLFLQFMETPAYNPQMEEYMGFEEEGEEEFI